jgi:thioredoxin-related protein
MKRIYSLLLAALLALGLPASAAEAPADSPEASPHAIDIPPWFKNTFLDFREDIAEAAAAKKRLLVYFGQDGCPYCRELMQVNFSQKDIVDNTRKHFDAIALNMWGDRETVWLDGKHRTEKELAAFLKVNFTPTLLFFDKQGRVALRRNGCYPPHKFRVALDYVAKRLEGKTAFGEYLKKAAPVPDTGLLHDEPYFMKPPYALQRDKVAAKKPLAVFFEQKHCASCDEMHATALQDADTKPLLDKLEIVRLDLFGKAPVLTPDGRKTTEGEWARALKVAYTPSIVFFDERGKEVFRVEAYVKTFHLQSALDYVASGAYRAQPEFQRYVESRAEALRAQGVVIDLWK